MPAAKQCEIDLNKLLDLAEVCPTKQPIADGLGITIRRLYYLIENNAKVKATYDLGRKLYQEEIKDEIVSLQLAAARNGSVIMLIFLGKVLCGQREQDYSESDNAKLDKLVSVINSNTKNHKLKV